MKIPIISGIIRRRFLINYRIDAQVLQSILPSVFEPQLQQGYGIGGICLIRLEQIRPQALPKFLGISSENGAHRFAVVDKRTGDKSVYIPRRDTNSRLNALAGGRVFPGQHHLANFTINEKDKSCDFEMSSHDGEIQTNFSGEESHLWPENSCFSDLDEASKFFEDGSLGYSPVKGKSFLQGLEFRTKNWQVENFKINKLRSSYFDNLSIFPEASIHFDHALLMRDIEHQWHNAASIEIS